MNATVTKSCRVYFVNFDYFAQQVFNTVPEAMEYAKKVGFESSIYDGSELKVSYSPIGGFHHHG